MAAEHKATCEKVENDLHELQNAYNNLDKELDEKQEEIEHYQNQLAGHSISGGERELNRQIKDLQEEVQQLEVEKADMMDQIQTLQHDAATLIEKDGKAARERSEQRKMLQNVYCVCIITNSRTLRSFKFNCVRVLRKRKGPNNGSESR